MIEISLDDLAVKKEIAKLIGAMTDTTPLMRATGEVVMEIAKQSFAKSASPDGTPWAENSPVTVLRYLQITGGNFKKDGSLTKKGQTRSASKKPLIGQSRDLSRQFSYIVTADSVTVSNTMIYAAMQQFGGTKQQFPHLWGDIPARPFMPIDDQGKLMPQAETEIIQVMQEYLDDLITGN